MVASNSAKHRMDRIIRLHEEIDQIKKDIRDIYAEEKAEGGDKTAMGEAITKIRKREKDKDGFDERENMVDVYLMAYNAPSGTAVATHTHAPVDRKARAALRTSEAMDDNKAFSAMMLADGLISEEAHAENIALSDAVARKYGAGVIDPETGEILDEPRRSDLGLNIHTKHEDIRTAPETAEEISRPAALAGSGGDRSIPSPDAGGEKMDGGCTPPGRSDDQSAFCNAKSGQATNTNSELLGGFPVAAAETNAEETGGVDADKIEYPKPRQEKETIAASLSEKAAVATQGEATAPTSDDGEATGNYAGEDRAAANAGGDDVDGGAERANHDENGEGAASALPAKPKFILRPHCLNPGKECGGSGPNHCWSCRRAMQKSEEAA